MTTATKPRHFAGDPPSRRVIRRCDSGGCLPQFLPDTMGSEGAPSARMCRQCRRYIKPNSSEPFRSEDEVNAWMYRLANHLRVQSAGVEPATQWALYVGGRIKQLWVCAEVPRSATDEQRLIFDVVLGGDPGEQMELTVDAFLDLVAYSQLRTFATQRLRGPHGSTWLCADGTRPER